MQCNAVNQIRITSTLTLTLTPLELRLESVIHTYLILRLKLKQNFATFRNAKFILSSLELIELQYFFYLT